MTVGPPSGRHSLGLMVCSLLGSVLAPSRPEYIYCSLDFMVEWICHRFAESREEKVAGIKYLPGARPLLGFPRVTSSTASHRLLWRHLPYTLLHYR